MFTHSVTASVFIFILNSIYESKIAGIIVSLCVFLKKEFINSKIFGLVDKLVSFVKTKYTYSFLSKIINARSYLQEQYEKSMLCFIITAVFNFLSRFFATCYDAVRKYNEGGLLFRTFSPVLNSEIGSYYSVFAFFIAVMMICPHEMWNNLYAVVCAAGFLVWYMIRYGKKSEKSGVSHLSIGFTAFAVIATVSSAVSYAKVDSARIMLFLLSAMIFCFLVKSCANSEKKLTYIIKVICIGAVITAIFGIIQRFMGVEVNPEYVDVSTSKGMPGRVFSTFANPNNFAELLVLTIPLTIALLFNSESKNERLLWGLCALLDVTAIGMSYSRSCWVALFIAAVIMIMVYDWRILIPIAVAAIFALPFLPESIINRMLSTGSMNDSSNAYRLYIWSGALKMIRNYWVSGIGAGPLNFAAFYRPLASIKAITAPHSHMIYMELIIEFGIFGAAAYFIYFFSVIRKGFAAVGKACKKHRAFIGAALGSMIGMLFVCAAEYVWFYPRDMFMFWIILGVLEASIGVCINKSNTCIKKGETL